MSGAPVSADVMPPLLDRALALAADGIAVFPCGANKKPVTEHGFYDASTDPAAIRTMFEKPGARLIGVPAGNLSGFDALDIDPRHGGETWERENAALLPDTRCHQTESGGRHYLLQHDPRMRN